MADRLTTLKTVLWALVGILIPVTVVRFVHGLGAVTHLSDAAPWGLWIGFDVMSGVALAAGGFVLAATVYIFGLERYRPFARPAILTAWLGYAAVAVGLLYDLGLPWRIWHPLVYWQYHSVLFEVAACVMLYLTVLTLEFAPTILEHPRFSHPAFRRVLRFLRKIAIPLVIAGIVLSTLHQSSLGSLFLITPHRLHPLWYSPIIYVLFFTSAVALGLMMVVLESLLARYFLGHEVHPRELGGLGLAASVALWIYVALRVGDLAGRGLLGGAFDGSWQANLFLAELGVSAVVPAALMLWPRARRSLAGVGTAAALVVGGMVLYRLDVSIVAFARPPEMGYVPSWEEIAVSVGIVSAFALVFIFFVERLRVYDDVGPGTASRRTAGYDPATVRGLLPRSLGAPRRYTTAALAGATLALLFLPVRGAERRPVATGSATRVPAVVRDGAPGGPRVLRLADSRGTPTGADPRVTLLFMLDGDRDGDLVLFDHEAHEERAGGETACGTCHHLDLPLDRSAPCTACHRDMYDSTSVFEHATHAEALGGNDGCVECHRGDSQVKSYETATPCVACHDEDVRESPVIAAPEERWRPAASYVEAMHGLCVECHEKEVAEAPGDHPADLADCATCHDADRRLEVERFEPSRDRAGQGAAGPPAGDLRSAGATPAPAPGGGRPMSRDLPGAGGLR
ncbi:MAG: Ni/Fe-hydrogenase cytochrome b subunit [Gemmatimonadota bacterium]|jgi:Ni/Fe-hydrogenase subunit HybB-like protein